nr:hypothetical protein [Angustibacter aerolatus]
MTTVGAVFTPDLPPSGCGRWRSPPSGPGSPSLWLWEDCFRESGVASAAAVLGWTERLRVGVGVLPVPLRNVALTAMEPRDAAPPLPRPAGRRRRARRAVVDGAGRRAPGVAADPAARAGRRATGAARGRGGHRGGPLRAGSTTCASTGRPPSPCRCWPAPRGPARCTSAARTPTARC